MSVIGGKKAHRNGENFEKLIDKACRLYAMSGAAYIEKTPEPMRPLKATAGGQFVACFTKRGQPDYKGTLKGGRAIVFEAKHADSTRIEKKRVTEEQAGALDMHDQLGAWCFVLVSLNFQSFYRVPWKVWANMDTIYGKVSMNENDLEPYRVNILHFLGEGADERTPHAL